MNEDEGILGGVNGGVGGELLSSVEGEEFEVVSEKSSLFISSCSCTNSSSGVSSLASDSYILERVSARIFVEPGACCIV